MNADFWLERWRTNQTGWHASETNKHLMSLLPAFGASEGKWTLIPLCGKSVDIAYLASHGRKVLGIDLSPIACRSFFEESKMPYTEHEVGKTLHFESENIRLICGDLFELEPGDLPPIEACYDRACLIALMPEQRKRYADWLGNALASGVTSLLITVEYPAGEKSGPPHSVSAEEVHELLSPHFSIELVRQADILNESPKYQEWGVTSLHEAVYLIRRN